jgi:hypothetical protein
MKSARIHPQHPSRVAAEERLNPRPLLILKPEEIRHPSNHSLENDK